MKKKVDLMALPSDNASVGQLVKGNRTGWTVITHQGMADMLSASRRDGTAIPYHLYLCLMSHDDVTDKDFVIGKNGELISTLANPKDASAFYPCKKVIASDDKALTSGGNRATIPKIPRSLVDYFAESKGTIENVMVDCWGHDDYGLHSEGAVFGQLKVTVQGEIVWSPVIEKTYTKSELVIHMDSYGNLCYRLGMLHKNKMSSLSWLTKHNLL